MKPKERTLLNATVAEQVDAPDLKPGLERGEGSSPFGGTHVDPRKLDAQLTMVPEHGREHLLELARKAIASMNARKDEDIDEWARKLAESVCELDD